MTHSHESPTGDEPLGRPFLADPGGADLPATPAATETRPYLLTGGRTEVDGSTIAMETVVVATGQHVPPHASGAAPSLETQAILALCERPLSVAEVAAHLRLPLGVARVLVADLVAAGALASSSAAGARLADLHQDVAFIERLIAGVTAF